MLSHLTTLCVEAAECTIPTLVEALQMYIPRRLVDHFSHYSLPPSDPLPTPPPPFPISHTPLVPSSFLPPHHTVVGYLVMFRLEELGLPHMRKFIFSQDTVNMYKVCVHVCMCACGCWSLWLHTDTLVRSMVRRKHDWQTHPLITMGVTKKQIAFEQCLL